MKEIMTKLGITDYEVNEDSLEATIEDSDEFGRIYTELENEYEVNEESSTVDNIIIEADEFNINLIANFDDDTYTIRVMKREVIQENIEQVHEEIMNEGKENIYYEDK